MLEKNAYLKGGERRRRTARVRASCSKQRGGTHLRDVKQRTGSQRCKQSGMESLLSVQRQTERALLNETTRTTAGLEAPVTSAEIICVASVRSRARGSTECAWSFVRSELEVVQNQVVGKTSAVCTNDTISCCIRLTNLLPLHA